MINHFRTLLLNRDGQAGFVDRPGEEYIPAEFAAMTGLPNYLEAPRRILFGQRPDWLFANYRTRQLLSLLHSTELIEFVQLLDSRITYDIANPDLLNDIFVTTASKEGIRFIGTPPMSDDSGQALRRWRVTVLDAVTVRIKQLDKRGEETDHSYATEGSWSTLVPLGSPRYYVSFDPTPGLSWDVDQRIRPQRSLGEIAASLDAGAARYWNDLFGAGTPRVETEPWKTFRNLWFDHPELPYRLGGLLAAIVFRMDERRNNGGQ